MSGNQYTVNSTIFDIVLYAEATPYRVIAPLDASTGTGTSPQETQPPTGVPPTLPVEASSALSPGAAAGIAIGAVLLLGVAGFYLWRYLRNRKATTAAGQDSQNLEAGGVGGVGGPRVADCNDKEVFTETANSNAKPPPYELDISGPTALPPPVGVVEADAGQKLHVQTGYRHDVPPFAVAALPELGGTAVEEGHENEQIPVAPAPMVGPRRAGPVSERRRVPRDGRARGSGDARRGDEPRDDGGHIVGLAADVGDAGGRGLDEYGAGVVSSAGAEEYTGGEGEVAADRAAGCEGGGAGEVGVGGDGDFEGGGGGR